MKELEKLMVFLLLGNPFGWLIVLAYEIAGHLSNSRNVAHTPAWEEVWANQPSVHQRR